MGVGTSMNNNSKFHEPPPLPPPFHAGIYSSDTSGNSNLFGASTQTLQRRDGKSKSCLRNDEWWQHKPSAPSLSNLCQPHETLLACATQITGWQTERTSRGQSDNQETMELTKTIAYLAAANHQLTSAHTVLLERIEQLYTELHKKKVVLRNHCEIDNELKQRIETIEDMIGIKYTTSINTIECENTSDKEDEISHESMTNQIVEKEAAEYLRREYNKAVKRIQLLESELKTTSHKNNGEECANDNPTIIKNNPVNIDSEKIIKTLLDQVSRLQADQLVNREINRQLTIEVEKQKKLVKKITGDYETTSNHLKKIESHLNERNQQFDCLMRDLDIAKLEISRLIKQLDIFHQEKDLITHKLVNLETNLNQADCTKEKTVALASEENWILRAELHEQIKNKMKQSQELDESLREIERLNKIIDTMKKVEQTDRRILNNETSTEESPNVSTARPNLEKFKKDLSIKREARQRAIAAVSSEMDRLRHELDAEKEAHTQTSRILDLLKIQAENSSKKSETFSVGTTTINVENWNEHNSLQFDAQRLTDTLKVSDELRTCIRLQIEKIDDLRYHLECDENNNIHRIEILKNITDTNREEFHIREIQINKLKYILSQIVARLGDEKFHVDINDDLRIEHDHQVEDIRRLKSLYDERIRVLVDLRDFGTKEMIIIKDKLKCLSKEKETLDEEMKKSEEKIDAQDTEISNLESQLGLTKADCRDLQNQMSVINSLFSQMLLSASSADMDLDRLTQLLQENHDLISKMAQEEGTEAAALPKLLLDLVEQVDGGREKIKSPNDECIKRDDDQQEETIAHNLPKVWRVLLELLSCHAVNSTSATSALLSTDPNVCYKSVDTPTGPRLVISVSKTYIRLKELILEKKHLEKEMGRMKQLNSHLESKLGEQEKRLSTVSAELSKTWNIVGRMQAQHQQLHTHEKILRYELQQKRKMLQELKQELEYCREKWESARQKNTNTEMEWKNLRREFASRKALTPHDSFNTSAESGFSDDRGDDTDEECIPTEEKLRIGPRRRTRKESTRTLTPDTESEQPTDNELSESKDKSTTMPKQRDPTSEIKDINCDNKLTGNITNETEQKNENFNPLDEALANVIEDLIKIDENTPAANQSKKNIDTTSQMSNLNTTDSNSECTVNQEKLKILNDVEHIDIDKSDHDNSNDNSIVTTTKSLEIIKPISVFSIGPFPINSEVISTKTMEFDNESNRLIVRDESPIQMKTTHFQTTEIIDNLHCDSNTNEHITKVSKSFEKDENHMTSNEIIATPSTSNFSPTSRSNRTPEEVLAARATRLKQLEEQADWLMRKMNATSRRGSELNTRLEELHEVYGEPPTPPPMPDVLPTLKLPTVNNGQAIDSTVEYVKEESKSLSENSL